MRATNSVTGKILGAAGIGALLFTYGCGTNNAAGLRAQDVAAAQPGSPVVVSCEPNQRTLVRPAVVNGQAISQVECVSTGEATSNVGFAQAPVAQPAPVAYRTAPRFVQSARNDGLGDAQVVRPVSYPVSSVARPVRTQEVVYEPRTVKPKRSVKKSAIIIGSSAGVGAGVGAAVGGKKGALLGAVIGGGGATLWDQITRRK
ncbi:MAG TPA: hypothetical protein VF147_14545 [Vicinamibacterales bacterium]